MNRGRLRVGLLVIVVAITWSAMAADHDPVLELPMSSHGGLIILPIDIGRAEGLDFVLDSGSAVTTVNDLHLARELGLHTRFLGVGEGFGGARLPILSAPDVAIGSSAGHLMRTDMVVHHVVELQEPVAGRSLHGLLGADLFARYAVDIDPAGAVVRLHPKGTPPPFERLAEVTVELHRGRPLVDARITLEGGRPTSAQLLLDTGAEAELMVVRGARRRLRAPTDGQTVRITGIGGAADAVLARAESLELGGVVLPAMDAAFIDRSALPTTRELSRVDGVLGNGLLKSYRTWIDLSVGRLAIAALEGSTEAD